MDKKDLIAKCRYYKGEKECPVEIKESEATPPPFFFWLAEKAFCNLSDKQREEYAAEFSRQFPSGVNADVPKALLQNLFVLYGKGCDMSLPRTINGFINSFLPGYLSGAASTSM